MPKTHIQDASFNLASGEQKEGDLAHTKVDPYQDPAYNALSQSPAHAVGQGHPKPVGQTDSLIDQVPKAVGQTDSMAPAHYKPPHADCLENDSDLDDDWD